MRAVCIFLAICSLLFCSTKENPKNSKQSIKQTSLATQESQKTHPPFTSKIPISQTSSSPARWFVGAGSGVNYSLEYKKAFAMIDLRAGVTYDNDWGRSYLYTNLSYAYLKNWSKEAQSSQGYFIDTLFNIDVGLNLVQTPSLSFLLMFGVGIGGRWTEQEYRQIHSFNTHNSFFITNLNIGLRSEIAKEHIISLTLKPQLTKGWYQNRELTFEYFKEMSLLLSYTFWKF